MIEFILLITLAYLMGSVCSAVIVSQMFSLPDPRIQGSKNPGATNVLRLSGKHYAAMVIVADILKGTIPVAIAHYFDASLITLGFTALAAVIGHMYPVFFEFKGGKGVATAIGALLGLQFFLGVLVSATWLIIAKFTRYSSLASIISICLAPLYAIILMGNLDIFPPLFFITILVLYKHRENITRLIDGTESKIKFKAPILEEVMEPDNSVQAPATSNTQDLKVAPEPIVKKEKAKKATPKTATKKAEPAKKTKTPATKAKTSKTKDAATPKKASKPKVKKEGI